MYQAAAAQVAQAHLVNGGEEVLVSQGEGLGLAQIHRLGVEVHQLRLGGPRSLCAGLGDAIEGDKALPADVVDLQRMDAAQLAWLWAGALSSVGIVLCSVASLQGTDLCPEQSFQDIEGPPGLCDRQPCEAFTACLCSAHS